MDNVVEFDVRNADQKRVNISGYNMKCVIMDQNNQEVVTADVDTTAITCAAGIGVMLIPASELDYIKPQFLKYTLYILNGDGTKTPVYSDTQFGISGTIDLLGGAMPEEVPPQIIDTFTYVNNDSLIEATETVYNSEAVEVNPRNDINEQHTITLEFLPTSLDAEVVVQITTDSVVHAFTEWITLETFQITNTTNRVIKVYNEVEDYSNNIGWLRVNYTPTTTNTGKLDKVLVKS